jgi:hypothetical protein
VPQGQVRDCHVEVGLGQRFLRGHQVVLRLQQIDLRDRTG